MARERFGLQGASELLKTFDALLPPTRRSALMRTMRKEIQPLAEAVKARAPYDWGDLQENLFIGTRLTKRQRSMAKQFGDQRSTAELHFGTADPAGFLNEFGLGDMPMNPFFRPEWEGRKRSIRDGIARRLGDEIVAAGVRQHRRTAKGR